MQMFQPNYNKRVIIRNPYLDRDRLVPIAKRIFGYCLLRQLLITNSIAASALTRSKALGVEPASTNSPRLNAGRNMNGGFAFNSSGWPADARLRS